MRAKDDARAGGHIRDFFNEYRALSFKVTHDEEVVDDLTTHIDGRTIIRQGQLDGFDCPDDARAETSGLCKDDSFDCHGTFTSMCWSLGCLNHTQASLACPTHALLPDE